MGILSQTLKRSKMGLKIMDGLLLRCSSTIEPIEIPAEVKFVSVNAFDGCGDKKIVVVDQLDKSFATPTEYMKYMQAEGRVVEVLGKREEESAVRKKIDWEERHFRICQTLLSKEDISDLNLIAVIKMADKMIDALKDHYRN